MSLLSGCVEKYRPAVTFVGPRRHRDGEAGSAKALPAEVLPAEARPLGNQLPGAQIIFRGVDR